MVPFPLPCLITGGYTLLISSNKGCQLLKVLASYKGCQLLKSVQSGPVPRHWISSPRKKAPPPFGHSRQWRIFTWIQQSFLLETTLWRFPKVMVPPNFKSSILVGFSTNLGRAMINHQFLMVHTTHKNCDSGDGLWHCYIQSLYVYYINHLFWGIPMSGYLQMGPKLPQQTSIGTHLPFRMPHRCRAANSEPRDFRGPLRWKLVQATDNSPALQKKHSNFQIKNPSKSKSSDFQYLHFESQILCRPPRSTVPIDSGEDPPCKVVPLCSLWKREVGVKITQISLFHSDFCWWYIEL